MLLVATAVAGIMILLLDAHPSWDDTGITAGLVFIAAALPGCVMPTRVWIWALTAGAWIPLWGILHDSNYGSTLALAVAFAGAYAGAAGRGLLPRERER